MRSTWKRFAAAVALTAGLVAAGGPAAAQEKIRIGLLLTLSGPSAVLGQHARDGFQLAIRQMGGRMGGREVEVLIVDDELRPEVAVQRAQALVERDKVDFVVGPIFSNVAAAIHRPVTSARTFLISPNAGPSNFAGRECHPFFFATSYQNDQSHEVLGKYAQDRGFRRVFLMAPNYQAGRDSLAGFKRHFRGEIVDEVYTQLGQLDFSAELARIAAARPDALFTFMPGGMGVNLVRQFRQAGLAERVPFLSAFTVDESTLPAQQDAAVGFFGGMNWAPNMDNPRNRAFVQAFEQTFNYVPGSYAMHAFDTANLIASAANALNGDLSNKDRVREELRRANFQSLRGNFRFGNNQYPIQDFYLVRVARRPDGRFQTEIADRVFENYQDVHARDCQM